jgi:hypothetical protein
MSNIYEDVASEALTAVSDEELRTGVGRLFEHAQRLCADKSIDLVVLTARRLACLYQLLVQQGMPALDGCQVVSDRFLDANPELNWASTSVLLLDDSVVVGTTLVRLHDDLRRKAPAVLCRSVCLDVDQQATYLFEGVDFEPLHKRSSQEVQAFSREVVVALFDNQVPFFSDFPVTRPVTFTPRGWKKYLETEDWHVADVTAPLLERSDRQALAQIPTEEHLHRLLSRIVPSASALVDSFKVRSYVRTSKAAKSVVFVPIAMLSSCKPAALDDALSEIAVVMRGTTEHFGISWRRSSPVAKHRLVQIYLSACLLAETWPRVQDTAVETTELSDEVLEPLPVSLYFGSMAPAVTSAFDAVVDSYRSTPVGHYGPSPQARLDQPAPSRLLQEEPVQDLLWEARELIAAVGVPEQPSKGELTKVGLIFSHAVSSIFGFLNREYEEPQRAEIRALGSRTEYDTLFGDGERRYLNQGFTMRELTSALIPDYMTGTPWSRCLVSLGIDAGNDLGIIVPVTRHDAKRDVVFRSYRLGETANLAGSPLSRAVHTDEIDEFTKTIDSGFPAFAVTAPIAGRRWMTRTHRRGGPSFDALRLQILRTFPGKVVSRFDGIVTSVDNDYFDAELLSPLRDDHRVARMKREQITNSSRVALRPGVSFSWSIFELEDGDAKNRTSRIRLRPSQPLQSERLYRSLPAVAHLAHGDEPTGDG